MILEAGRFRQKITDRLVDREAGLAGILMARVNKS
jgi:hypothetical protein